MSEKIEVNLRYYLYGLSGLKNQELKVELEKVVPDQVENVFNDLTSDRDKLEICSYIREAGRLIDFGFLGDLTGVVVEFGLENGVDAFAGYSDGLVVWYDCSSSKMIEVELKRNNKSKLGAVLSSAKKISDVSRASSALPLEPPAGFTLVSLINTHGVSFGMGPSRDMATDSICGPIVLGALNIRKEILSLDFL